MTTRRQTLRSLFGSSLLMPGMLSELLAEGVTRPQPPAKAKRVIMIYATGGVSHIDTFDPKSAKNGRDGTGNEKLMGNLFGSGRNPRCGTEVSDLFPKLRDMMDEVCLIRSMNASHFDHSEATLGMHTGSPTFARPSMGSWISYGMGSMNRDLPSFVVIAPHLPYGGTQVYANGFLPAIHQGTRVIPGDRPIANLETPAAARKWHAVELDLVA